MCRILLVTLGLLAILFGITGFWMLPKQIQKKIEPRLELKIGTKMYERFTKIPIPLRVKFYLFNITNADQVLRGHDKPKFEQVGPFMYQQWRRREIVDFLDANRKITYREYKRFFPMFSKRQAEPSQTQSRQYARPTYDPNNNYHETTLPHYHNFNSYNQQRTFTTTTPQPQLVKVHDNGTETILNPGDFRVTIINLPLLSLLWKFSQISEPGSVKRAVLTKALSRLIEKSNEKILVTKQANEFLFDGFKFGLLQELEDLLSNTFGFNFISPLPNNTFGFFYNKNDTWARADAGEMTVFTGRNGSMDHFMQVDTWNGKRALNVWPNNTEAGNRCNEIRGTDGSSFHPGVTRDKVLTIFSPLVCTSIFVKYKEDTSVRDISLLRFTTPPEVFAAPRKNPLNACYCTAPTNDLTTTTSSYLDATSSQYNTRTTIATYPSSQSRSYGHGAYTTTSPPITATTVSAQPRSSQSDRCYIDGLMDLSLCRGAPIAASGPHFYNADPNLALAAGLKPNQTLHETHLDIEPMTGAVFRAASRAQLNAYVEQSSLDVIDPQLIGHMVPMIVPMLWLEESAEIDEKSSAEFKQQLLAQLTKVFRMFTIAIVVGVFLIVCIAIEWFYTICKTTSSSSSSRSSNTSPKRSYEKMHREDSGEESDDNKTTRLFKFAHGGASYLTGETGEREYAAGAQRANLAALGKSPAEDESDELMAKSAAGDKKLKVSKSTTKSVSKTTSLSETSTMTTLR